MEDMEDMEDNVGKAKEQLSPRMNIGTSTFRPKGEWTPPPITGNITLYYCISKPSDINAVVQSNYVGVSESAPIYLHSGWMFSLRDAHSIPTPPEEYPSITTDNRRARDIR